MRPGRNGKTSPDRAYFSMVWVNPLDVSLVEIGYSHNDEPRLKWHRDYSSSIYNPFEAILGLLYPQKFQLHQYVIHCCVDVRHVGLAELLFNRLGEGYIGDAGGFGQSPAGFSVSSPDDCTTAYWEDAAKSSLKQMEVEAIQKVEKDRRTAMEQEKQRPSPRKRRI